MSIASEILRLQEAKEAIKESIESKGVEVSTAATISSYSSFIDQIFPLEVHYGPGIPTSDVGNNGDIFIQTTS